MKPYCYIVLLLLVSCQSIKQKEYADAPKERATDAMRIEKKATAETIIAPLHFNTECDTIPLELIESSRKRIDLTTFQKQTYVYCSPSTESKIIDSLPLNSVVESWKPLIRSYKPKNVSQEGNMVTVNRAKEHWYEIYMNGQYGFLFEKGLTLKKLGNNILFGEKPNDYKYRLLSFDSTDKAKVIDSMDLNRNHGYDLEWLNYNGLSFCNGIIRYRDFRQSCPGTSTTTFIAIDDEGGLTKLTYSYVGESSTATIYFPLKFNSGKTLLVADGNAAEIFNYYSGELNTFDVPRQLNVPINELIVEIKREYSGTLEVPEDATEISRDTTYYRWNGSTLDSITTTDHGTTN